MGGGLLTKGTRYIVKWHSNKGFQCENGQKGTGKKRRGNHKKVKTNVPGKKGRKQCESIRSNKGEWRGGEKAPGPGSRQARADLAQTVRF